MAEYLAPGVYVEEVDRGGRPIEGVSTSTAGLVGMAERGPLNRPILITSAGDYQRWFGGLLPIEEFTDAADPDQAHCYLPHAIEGFFTNGGLRAYVVRVAPAEAMPAEAVLYDRGVAGGPDTILLRRAAQGEGGAGTTPLYLLDTTGIVAHDSLRIGDGNRAEYVEVATAVAPAGHVALSSPLSLPHAAGQAISHHIAGAPIGAPTLDGAAAAGSVEIRIDSGGPDLSATALPFLVELFADGFRQIAAVRTAPVGVGGDVYLVRLNERLGRAYPPASNVVILPSVAPPVGPPTLSIDAAPGDSLVFASAAVTGPIIEFGHGSANHEVRHLGQLTALTLARPLTVPIPAGAPVAHVDPDDAGAKQLTNNPAPGDTRIRLNDRTGLVAGQRITIDPAGLAEQAIIAEVIGPRGPAPDAGEIRLAAALVGDPANGDDVVLAARGLTAPAPAGARTVALDGRAGLSAGQLLRVGNAANDELAVILAMPGAGAPYPDAGPVTLANPLAVAHLFGEPVEGLTAPIFPAIGGNDSTSVLLAAPAGATTLWVSGGAGYALDDVIAVRGDGPTAYLELAGTAVPANTGEVTLNAGLSRAHEPGEVAVGREPMITVEALDVGAWGNRLSVSVEDEPSGLAARGQTEVLTLPLQLRLRSLTGIEPGTLLEVTNPGTGASVLVKVRDRDLSTRDVFLDPPGLDAAALAQLGAIGGPLAVRSREFRVTVSLRRRPDPAVPSRNNQVEATETFRHLSMDHRHSRYFEPLIGAIGGPERLEDGRPEGESPFIRVRDLAPNEAATEAVRLGPEALVAVTPAGLSEPARHLLSGGNDSLATMGDDVYLGDDDPEPLQRTGLQSLRNIPQVSIVAIPGRSSALLQAGLIAHCELMRYRFAVLDSATPDASLAEVQAQRQAFDTKYAALYYPWFTVPDPMPDNLAAIGDFHLPPSGHVIGIYARTDQERGVHKAPANEVVRGITGLSRRLNKGEHDILNPSPVNISVTRDFRPDGRGIRVWGARCITSDTAHKYVPVRRLLIFLEQSIERGLQWVVFEPNAEPLWARVRQSIVNFLTDVWRSGALEGTKPEEAFFVRCDRTTMTQTDIDNGRLICEIGVAPVKPAEFVIVRIGLFTATAQE